MSQTSYIEEANEQLSNTTFYKKLDKDHTVDFKRELLNMTTGLSTHTRSRMPALIPRNPQPGTFYTIQKLHKLPKLIDNMLTTNPHNISTSIDPFKIFDIAKSLNIHPPGRPIISNIGTLTEHLSGYVDSVIKPFIPSIPSYIKDTTHFLNNLSQIPNLQTDALLVTMDVTSLYANIPHAEGLVALESLLSKNLFPLDHIQDILSISRFILTHNNFIFKDQHYLQISGTAMGTKMAPNYANAFMSSLEEKLINSFHLKPMHYVRYIDDIFFIWNHGIDALELFKTHANAFHPTIKFTFEHSQHTLPFLDVSVKVTDGKLSTSLYCKPTNRHCYLNYNSFHPLKLKQSLIFSQCLRIR
ncbi:uncharacterized protein LOC117114603 [Anneissia japonica]|uniref:uncharacterized protein LOC117114603 n=1 Tax=Anneissia japonica TaxID=1529436 RepID=UPI001425AE0E|nr:uncharacterized protein LOC117114603 [Anneissia japonica]